MDEYALYYYYFNDGNDTSNFSDGNDTFYYTGEDIFGLSFDVNETYHLPMDIVTLVLAICGWIIVEMTCKGNIRNTYRLKTAALVLRSSLRIVASRLDTVYFVYLFITGLFEKIDSVLLIIIQMISVVFLNILYKCTCDFEKGDGKNDIIKKVLLCLLFVTIVKVSEEVFFVFSNVTGSPFFVLFSLQPIESIISCVSTFYCCFSGVHVIRSIFESNKFVSRACPRLKMRNVYLSSIAAAVVTSQLLLSIVNLIDRVILSVHGVEMHRCLKQYLMTNVEFELSDICIEVYAEKVEWLDFVDPSWASLIEMTVIGAVSVYKFMRKL